MLLPHACQYTRIKQQAGTRFEAFDFSAHNKTRFGGLENDLANCYTNPLWQVLYFVPAFRCAQPLTRALVCLLHFAACVGRSLLAVLDRRRPLSAMFVDYGAGLLRRLPSQ